MALMALFFAMLLWSIPYELISRLEQGGQVKILGPANVGKDFYRKVFSDYYIVNEIDRDVVSDEFYYAIVDNHQDWVSYDQASPYLKAAILISEDWSFYEHPGVDLDQLYSAFREFLETGRLRGASTITQQVVKNLFLDHRHSFVRKLREVIISLYMETKLSKERIFEIYLNIAHFGNLDFAREHSSDFLVKFYPRFENDLDEVEIERLNFYGVHHASLYYFNRKASELSPRKSSFLAMLLPNPNRYNSSFYREQLSEYARNRIYHNLNGMRILTYIDRDKMHQSLINPFEWERDGEGLMSHFTLFQLSDIESHLTPDNWIENFRPRFRKNLRLYNDSSKAFEVYYKDLGE